MSRLHHLYEHTAILGIGASVESECKSATKHITFAELHYWEVVGIICADDDFAIGARLVPIHVVLRQTLQLRRISCNTLLVVVDIAIKRRLLVSELIVQFAQARAGSVILVHASQPE